MRFLRKRPSLPLVFAFGAYLLAFIQSPGAVVADTKIHLYLDPSRFFHNVLSLWSQSPDLGHVWASQYGGYAWPMAPWFAAGDLIGLPVWVTHRLWLGTILALAAWGVIKLLDRLVSSQRSVVHVVAALLYTVNPFVTVYSSRASITLVAYAALPWLILFAHRGLREPRRWRWPVLFALVLASSGGGINAATAFFALLGPVLLVAYERLVLGEGKGAIFPLAWRTGLASLLTNVWWLVPLFLAGRGAPNFLIFTEQPGTIWSTTTIPETLRLMGFWTSYVGTGFTEHLTPYQSSAPALLFLLPVVLAGLVVPAVAIAAFPLTARARYAAFFALMLLVGVLVMTVSWPDGTPMRTGVTGAYYRLQALQPLRTTYKAGGLVALGLAVLFAQAVAVMWSHRGRRIPVTVAVAVVAGLSAWPLVSGRALERHLEIDVPQSWHRLADDLDERPDDTRAVVLPPQVFASYDWGGTVDAVLPALTNHPVTTHWIVPFSDMRSTALQFAIDDLITQERLLPGQLRPLLELIGTGDVVVATDGDRAQSGQMPSADAVRLLRNLGGLGTPAAVYGPVRALQPSADSLAPPVRARAITRYELPTGGLLRLVPRANPVIADGSADALTALAGFGELQPQRAIRYSFDVDDIRSEAERGASLVIADGNRRRAFVAARPRGNHGPTLPLSQNVSSDGVVLDAAGGANLAAETVAEVRGVKSVSAPASPQVTQFPEQRAFAAIDGDPSTAWIADRMLVPSRHVLTVELAKPQDIKVLRLLPYSDSRAVVKAVKVNGKRFSVTRGWNALDVDLKAVSKLDIAIAKVAQPDVASGAGGGIRELQVPGAPATEWLRVPTVIEQATAASNLDRSSLTYLFERTTADVPARQRRYTGERGAREMRDAQDPEPLLRRIITPPVARTFAADAWVSTSPRLSDGALDRLLGTEPVAGAAGSSSRFNGTPRNRGSRAFDGRGSTAWIGQWISGRPAWLGWTTRSAVTVSSMTIVRARRGLRAPTAVRLHTDGAGGPVLRVGEGGHVKLPQAVTGRRFRLEIVDSRFPAGTPQRLRERRAVAIAELKVSGAPRAVDSRGADLRLRCGTARFAVSGSGTVDLGGTVSRARFESGAPVHLSGCGPVRLSARNTDISDASGRLRIDRLRLAGAAPAQALARPVVGPSGRVVSPGAGSNGDRRGIRLAVADPSWLVLGQSFDAGWRAECDGKDLGRPVVMQGYANAWPVDAACKVASVRYGPQCTATAALWISLVTSVLFLLGLVLTRFRGRAAASPEARHDPLPPAQPRALSRGAAVRIAALAAILIGANFGLRAGIVGAPVLFWILWRGVSDAALGKAIAVLLGVGVPVVYVVVALFGDLQSVGGNSTRYGADRLVAHWMAVAAIVLFCVVLVRRLLATRRVAAARFQSR